METCDASCPTEACWSVETGTHIRRSAQAVVVHSHHQSRNEEELGSYSNQLQEDRMELHRVDNDSLRMVGVHNQAVEGLLEVLRLESSYDRRA
jgi:hypothetical protein